MFVERSEVVDDWTRVENEWILIRDGRARTFRFRLSVYSGQELKDGLHAAGFVRVTLHGDLDGLRTAERHRASSAWRALRRDA